MNFFIFFFGALTDGKGARLRSVVLSFLSTELHLITVHGETSPPQKGHTAMEELAQQPDAGGSLWPSLNFLAPSSPFHLRNPTPDADWWRGLPTSWREHPHLPPLLLLLTTVLAVYMATCRALRYRHQEALRRKFGYGDGDRGDRAALARMTADEAQQIIRYIANYEFPLFHKVSLEFALFKVRTPPFSSSRGSCVARFCSSFPGCVCC